MDEPIAEWPAWLLPLTRRRTTTPSTVQLEPPPSVQAVVDLLNRMPNLESTSRDEWWR